MEKEKVVNALPGQETYQALVSLKNKMNRLETIEAELKKHIEVLKRAQVEYSCLEYECLEYELKGAERWVATIIKELEGIIKEKNDDNTWNDFNYLYFVELVFNNNVCDFA